VYDHDYTAMGGGSKLSPVGYTYHLLAVQDNKKSMALLGLRRNQTNHPTSIAGRDPGWLDPVVSGYQ